MSIRSTGENSYLDMVVIQSNMYNNSNMNEKSNVKRGESCGSIMERVGILELTHLGLFPILSLTSLGSHINLLRVINYFVQLVERATLDLLVVSSSPTLGIEFIKKKCVKNT